MWDTSKHSTSDTTTLASYELQVAQTKLLIDVDLSCKLTAGEFTRMTDILVSDILDIDLCKVMHKMSADPVD